MNTRMQIDVCTYCIAIVLGFSLWANAAGFFIIKETESIHA